MLMPNRQPTRRNPRPALRWLFWGLGAGMAGLTAALVVALSPGPGAAPQASPPAAATLAGAATGAEPAAAETGAATGAEAATAETGAATSPGWPDPLVLARSFVRLAAGGSQTLATTLAPGSRPPPAWLADLQVTPEDGGAVLPGPGPEAEVLLPITYRRPGRWTRGYLRVQVAPATGGGYLVAGVEGPIAPREEWARFDLPVAGQDRRELPGLEGPAVLWTPRRPEPGLVAAMEVLRQQLAGQVPVLMAVDLGTPVGWDRTAREQGWQGEIIWTRGYLDRYPLPANWAFLGARGVLIASDGRVVASLGELDPSRYGLTREDLPATALPVVRAYGLLPTATP